MRTLVIAAALLATSTSLPPKQGARQWSGLIKIGKEAHFNRLNVDAQGYGELVDPEADAAKPLKVGPVTIRGRELSFTVPHDGQSTQCRGRLLRDALVGTTGACVLNFTATSPLPDPTKIFGAWKMADGRVVAIGTMADFLQPTLFDYRSGRARYLYHRPDGRFTAGAGMVNPEPTQLLIKRSASALEIRQGKRVERGHLLRFAERPIEWSNGAARLSGTLVMPLGRGPFPAVVLTQMSSPANRDAYRTWAYYFASKGIAALIYDRRGLGRSVGETAKSGMPELAADAVEGVHALQKQSGIQPRCIGTWGHSQGGWIAPLAAAQSPDVAFVIMQSGPGVTAAEQEIYRVGASARAMGLTEKEVAAATAYESALMGWVKDGSGRADLLASAKANANAPWASLVELVDASLPATSSERSKLFWYLDPASALAQVRVPILALYGDRDGFVPVERSREVLKRAFAQSRNPDAEIVTLPGAIHGMWQADKDSFAAVSNSNGFHPAYWPTIDRWLQREGLSR